jgi:membrane fusion protein, multidrug efflux system
LEAKKASAAAADDQVNVAKANMNAAKAAVMANAANVKRLQAKQGFQRVVAPFDGVITVRKVDQGALITEGSQSSNLELYQMGKLDRLRVYVSVPQRIARYLKTGESAELLVPEYPDRKFIATVTNVSGGLDPNTRTRQTEIQIDNPDHALLPGMYAEVKISGLREAPWIRVAGTCLVARPDGEFVVVIKDGKAHYQPVTIGRDYGSECEIRTGLEGNEVVIVSPNDDLKEGDPVQAAPVPAA